MATPQRPPRPVKPSFSSQLTQMFPARPSFTEKDILDLSGNVYIVTGSNTGVGKEVANILYSKNARVYLAARSEEKVDRAIADIKESWPQSTGSLAYQHLDLADLSTIKASAEQFTSQKTKLNALFNNAGVQALAAEPPNNVIAQGYEIHLGVNVLGNFLFTKLLTRNLVATAKVEPANTVRVVWVSSLGLEMVGEQDYGITTAYQDYWPTLKPLERYGISKAGNWLYGVEFAKRHRADGVVSVPCNPGHLRSALYRDGGAVLKFIINNFIACPSVNGAYTELFSALSPTITIDDSGSWVVPWGRSYPLREDLEDVKKSEAEGGNGHAEKFWQWSEDQLQRYT